MLRFKQYLAETVLREKNNAETNADLIYQKLLDVLDHAHIDFDQNRIEFHIGRLVKNSDIDLRMVIRPSDSNAVRLGKSRENSGLTIVVDTRDKLPVRSEIDAFLAKDRERALKIKSEISKYIRDHYANQIKPNTRTRYEEESEANTSQQFEGRYEVLVKQLKKKMQEFREMTDDLEAEMDTEDAGKKETIKMAIRQLGKEYFGDNSEEFQKIARGLMSKGEGGKNTGFANQLSPENKKKLESRLDSFYDQHIKPLMKK